MSCGSMGKKRSLDVVDEVRKGMSREPGRFEGGYLPTLITLNTLQFAIKMANLHITPPNPSHYMNE